MKDKVIWVLKLVALTAAIFWFMTKGFTISVGESILGSSDVPSGSSSQSNILYAFIIIAFVAVMIIKQAYDTNVHKPKSRSYKKYKEIKNREL
jgi:hypothetical protein